MNTKISNLNIALNGKIKTGINFLLLVFLILSLTYFYFLIQTIFNVVSGQELEAEVPRFNSFLQEKKFEYIYLKNGLNEEKAEEYGLIALDDSSIEYITRDSIGFLSNHYGENL